MGHSDKPEFKVFSSQGQLKETVRFRIKRAPIDEALRSTRNSLVPDAPMTVLTVLGLPITIGISCPLYHILQLLNKSGKGVGKIIRAKVDEEK